jgi:hypothetical protein
MKSDPEPEFLTLKGAAKRVGVPYWKLLRAANLRLFPTYQLLNTKRLVRLSEVVASMAERHE